MPPPKVEVAEPETIKAVVEAKVAVKFVVEAVVAVRKVVVASEAVRVVVRRLVIVEEALFTSKGPVKASAVPVAFVKDSVAIFKSVDEATDWSPVKLEIPATASVPVAITFAAVRSPEKRPLPCTEKVRLGVEVFTPTFVAERKSVEVAERVFRFERS